METVSLLVFRPRFGGRSLFPSAKVEQMWGWLRVATCHYLRGFSVGDEDAKDEEASRQKASDGMNLFAAELQRSELHPMLTANLHMLTRHAAEQERLRGPL